MLDHAGTPYWPFSLKTDGGVTIDLRTLGSRGRPRPPFDQAELRREFVRRLNEAGLSIPEDAIDRLPSFRIAALAKPEALDAFKRAIEWFRETVRSGAPDQPSG